MKKILFIALLAFTAQAYGQSVPDTIWTESLTDSTFIVAVGTMNKRNDKLNVNYLDQVYDSAGVAEFAFNRIERNEQLQREADIIKLQADALTALYSDVNGILQDFVGAGYINVAFQKFSPQYVGFYRAQLGVSQVFVQLQANATAVQVDAQGQPVGGGFTGTWDVITPSRWRLKDFFPTNILAAGSVFNRLDNPDTAFMAVGSDVVITKMQQ